MQMEKFKYIQDVTTNVGTICLYSQIGDSVDQSGNWVSGISGGSFAYEMQWLQNNCEKINIRINSVGGSVFDGYSIVSAILNSSVPVDCYIDGLAASMAGVIAVAGNKCYMADYGTLMLHNPSGGNDKKVLSLVKDTLVTILTNRTNQKEEDIIKMMDKETWLNSKQALELGMVDEIVSSSKKVKMPKNASLYDMALIYNKAINPKKNMTKINTLLKISNDAGESEQESAIVNLNKQIEDSKNEIETLKQELKVLKDEQDAREAAAKESLKNKATLLANNAFKEGKIKEDEVAKTIENASKDEDSFEFVSNMIGRLGNAKQSQKPFNVNNVKEEANSEDKTKWSYSDWEKKDAEGLKKMYVENRSQFDELVKTIKVK